jgi:hypothetical protein
MYLKSLSAFSVTRAAHAPYSPDLAPSDLKHRFEGKELASAIELLEAIAVITGAIRRSDRAGAFRNGEERLGKCIEVGGEYVS